MKNKVIVIMFLFIFGCSPRVYQEDVTSFVGERIQKCKRYMIVPKMANIGIDDPEFVEYRNYIISFLSQHGYENVKTVQSACSIVWIDYALGKISYIPHDDVYPVMGQIGGGTSTVTVTSITGKTASGTINTPPSFGVTGYIQDSWVEQIATNYLFIEAIDIDSVNKDKKIVPLWRVKILQTGKPASLRDSIPKMLEAAKGSVGIKMSRTVDIHKDGKMKVVKESQ